MLANALRLLAPICYPTIGLALIFVAMKTLENGYTDRTGVHHDRDWPTRDRRGLDPLDWDDIHSTAHQIIDDAIAHIRDVRDRPSWPDMPDAVRQSYTEQLPQAPKALADVYKELRSNLIHYPAGSILPQFSIRYMGSGSFSGAQGGFLAVIDGVNLGVGNFAGSLMDRQVTNWLKELVGFPALAGVKLISGGSMANILGLTVARNVMSGIDARAEGVDAINQPL